MSISFDRFFSIVSLTMPYAVDLSVRRGVGGCVWPSSVSVTLSGAPLWALWKHAPTSDYAAEATTFLITAATLRIDPLSVFSSGDLLPRKKQTTETAPCVGDREVRGIAMDVQYHVGGMISDCGVRVSG
jgi:hypothetical protein